MRRERDQLRRDRVHVERETERLRDECYNWLVDGQQQRRRLREPPPHADEVSGPLSADARRAPGRSRIARVLQLTFLAALFWTALGVFFASQLVLAGLPWSTALSFSMPRWYVWGLLTPGVFWVDRRLGAKRSLAARVAWHLPLGIAWTLLSIIIRLVSRPLRGSPWPPSVADFFFERFYWDLLIYAVIAGVSIARDYASQVRERERQAHELALETADLERRLVEARLQSLRTQPEFF